MEIVKYHEDDNVFEMRYPYFVSGVQSTKYFSGIMLEHEFKITDEMKVFYSISKEKCIDWLHSKSDYFLDVSEKWELDNVECSEEWNPSFATFDIISKWKPLGLPANDNERLLMEIEKWFRED